MHANHFVNHPDLVGAIGQVGPLRVFELLRTQPDLAGWIASGRHLALELVELLDQAIMERCADIPISELTPERLRCVASEVFEAVPSMRQN